MSIATTTSVSAGDVRRMLDLVSAAAGSEASVVARHALVLRGIGAMTRATVCVGARVRRSRHGSVRIESMVDLGWTSESHRQSMVAATHSPLFRDEPLEVAFDKVLATPDPASAGLTFCRRELMDDRGWYGSGHFESVRRPMGIDDCIYSIFPLRQLGHYACLGLHRGWSEDGRATEGRAGGRFEERDRLVADFVWQALGFLHELPMGTTPGREQRLPSELRQVFALLRSGVRLKGAERKIGLSARAFRQQCDEVYRFFGVRGRMGLLLKLANVK